MPDKKGSKKPKDKESSKAVKSQNKTELAAQQALESVKNNRQRLEKFLFFIFIVGIATGLALYATSKKQPVIAKVSEPVLHKKPQVLGQTNTQTDSDKASPPLAVSTPTKQAVSKSTAATTPRAVNEQAVQPAPTPMQTPAPMPGINTVTTTPTAPITTTDPNSVAQPSAEPLVVTVNHVIDQTLHLISLK